MSVSIHNWKEVSPLESPLSMFPDPVLPSTNNFQDVDTNTEPCSSTMET